MEATNEGPRLYFVTVIDGARVGFLAGPYATHDAALADVDIVRRMAERVNDRAIWYAFGTSSVPEGTPAPRVVFSSAEVEARRKAERETLDAEERAREAERTLRESLVSGMARGADPTTSRTIKRLRSEARKARDRADAMRHALADAS